MNTARYEGTRQKADLASIILQDVGLNHHGGKFKWHFYDIFDFCVHVHCAANARIVFYGLFSDFLVICQSVHCSNGLKNANDMRKKAPKLKN